MPNLPRSRARQRDQRPNSAARGYGRRWRRYRLMFLRRHPLCAHCGGAAEHVDHITPIAGGSDPLFWRASNHQPLCQSCHSVKTARERGRPPKNLGRLGR